MRKNIDILMGHQGCFKYRNSVKNANTYSGVYDKPVDIKKLQREKINLIIEEKELLIEELVIPRTRKAYIEGMVENALLQKFPSLNEIAFDYKVIEKHKTQLRVLVYCVNLSNLLLLQEKNFQGAEIVSVKVIQQIYAEIFSRRTKKKDFSGIVVFKNYFYFFYLQNGIMYENKVEEFNNISEIVDFIKGIYKKRKFQKVLYIYEENPTFEINQLIAQIWQLNIVILSEQRKSSEVIACDEGFAEVR